MSSLTRQLLRDADIDALFSAEADLDAMVRFECALANAQAQIGVIEKGTADRIEAAVKTFQPAVDAIEQATAVDGVPVPELVRQLKAHVGEPQGDRVHHGATSQDVIDTSLVLRLAGCLEILERRVAAAIDRLDRHIERFGDHGLTGRTRMQKALGISVQDRLVAWKTPLMVHLKRLDEMRPRVLQVQFGGAVGTLDKLGHQAADVKQALADELGLGCSAVNWHSRRDGLVELANWVCLVSGAIGKIGQDVVLMAQNDLAEIRLIGTGQSSAMPHKQNPIKAETLVALARYNAVQISGMHQALIHEQERSGAAWTLEWMILPEMMVAAGAATRTLITLLDEIDHIGKS